MSKFDYTARHPSGGVVSGSVEATDRVGAIKAVERLGYMPIRMGLCDAKQQAPSSPKGTATQWKTADLALASLVLGILGWLLLNLGTIPAVICGAIPAVTCGHVAKARIRRDAQNGKGKGKAIVGLVLGYVLLAGSWPFAVTILVTMISGKIKFHALMSGPPISIVLGTAIASGLFGLVLGGVLWGALLIIRTTFKAAKKAQQTTQAISAPTPPPEPEPEENRKWVYDDAIVCTIANEISHGKVFVLLRRPCVFDSSRDIAWKNIQALLFAKLYADRALVGKVQFPDTSDAEKVEEIVWILDESNKKDIICSLTMLEPAWRDVTSAYFVTLPLKPQSAPLSNGVATAAEATRLAAEPAAVDVTKANVTGEKEGGTGEKEPTTRKTGILRIIGLSILGGVVGMWFLDEVGAIMGVGIVLFVCVQKRANWPLVDKLKHAIGILNDDEIEALKAHGRELEQDQKVADALLPIDKLLIELRVELKHPELASAKKKLIMDKIDEAERQRNILVSSASDSFKEYAQRQSELSGPFR